MIITYRLFAKKLLQNYQIKIYTIKERLFNLKCFPMGSGIPKLKNRVKKAYDYETWVTDYDVIKPSYVKLWRHS